MKDIEKNENDIDVEDLNQIGYTLQSYLPVSASFMASFLYVASLVFGVKLAMVIGANLGELWKSTGAEMLLALPALFLYFLFMGVLKTKGSALWAARRLYKKLNKYIDHTSLSIGEFIEDDVRDVMEKRKEVTRPIGYFSHFNNKYVWLCIAALVYAFAVSLSESLQSIEIVAIVHNEIMSNAKILDVGTFDIVGLFIVVLVFMHESTKINAVLFDTIDSALGRHYDNGVI